MLYRFDELAVGRGPGRAVGIGGGVVALGPRVCDVESSEVGGVLVPGADEFRVEFDFLDVTVPLEWPFARPLVCTLALLLPPLVFRSLPDFCFLGLLAFERARKLFRKEGMTHEL
jgi:hypothetical protein